MALPEFPGDAFVDALAGYCYTLKIQIKVAVVLPFIGNVLRK